MHCSASVVIFVVSLLGSVKAYYQGRCRLCRNVRSLDECVTWAECTTQQECFMERIVTDDGEVRFNGGCRSNDTCQQYSTDLGAMGRRRDAVTCSACCSDNNYCNEKLCGIQRATNLTMCNQCDGAHASGNHAMPPAYPEDCTTRTVCQADEMCYASTYTHGDSDLRHHSGCRKKVECLALIRFVLSLSSDVHAIGKRDRQICTICCGDDMCNNIACEAIKGRLTSLNSVGSLDLNTLREIV